MQLNNSLHIRKDKEEKHKYLKQQLLDEIGEEFGRQIALASEKGASSWLTSLPLGDYGYVLNKQEFKDAILLRYNYTIHNMSRTCPCGELNSTDHSLTCKLGGYISLRHNTVRDTVAYFLSRTCKDVVTEPKLLPLNGEKLPKQSNTQNDARLDVSCRGFWTPLDKAFVDIRVFNPNTLSNAKKPIDSMYTSHKSEKKKAYNHRVMNIEHGLFTPLVFSTSGGISAECEKFMKHLASLLATKTNQKYSDTITHIKI